MIKIQEFPYKPHDSEAEKASNSYLMSLIAAIIGLPLPIINLIATFIFFVANKQGTYFVRWHCTQALLSQFSLLIINTIAFWWVISIVFYSGTISNAFIAYIITIMIANFLEFIATIYTAIATRKGKHVEWWFYGSLTNLTCKPEN